MRFTRLLVLFLVLQAACGGGSTGPNPPAPPPPPPPPPAPVATVTVTPGNATLVPMQSMAFAATLRDDQGNVLAGRPIAWSVAPLGFAAVDGDGMVTATAPGATNVIATSEGRNGSAAVTVNDGGFVGPAGGQVVAAAGNVTLVLPAGALAAGTAITVSPAVNPPADPALVPGTAYDLGPNGTQFAQPVALRIRYNPAALPAGANPAQFRVARLVGGLWTPIPGSTVNVGTATVTGQTGGFSVYAIVEVLPPVISVTLHGTFRVKVGDDYAYTATARLADGTVVVRPMTWSIVELAKGVMTPGGVLTPLATGTITIVVTIDGVAWEGTVDAYDWVFLSGGGSLFLTLAADNQISNKFGTSEYAELAIACSNTGFFTLWVDTEHFVTANGLVAWSFDGGTIQTETWIEFDLFSALGHPGLTNQARKNFALAMAGSRIFGFAFTEFQGSAKAMLFRVTGLAGRLGPLLAACPGAAIRAGAEGGEVDLRQAYAAARAALGPGTVETDERRRRMLLGSEQTPPPSAGLRTSLLDSQPAARRP